MNELVIMDDVYKSYADRVHGIKLALVGAGKGRVSKQKKWVLAGLSLTVKRGVSLGIIGPNGAGKSTILRLLQGSTTHNTGEIIINGSVSTAIELGAGFHPELTGLENIKITAALFGLQRNRINEVIDEMSRFSELGEALTWPVRSYSSGMVARLAFSVLTQTQTDLLCIDEVLSVGDYSFQKKSFQFLKSLKDNGGTFVIVSHDFDNLRNLCDEVLILGEGKAEKVGPANEILDFYVEQQRSK